MNKYQVRVQATIVKAFTVYAEDEQAAYEAANEAFNVNYDGVEESYDQEVTHVELAK